MKYFESKESGVVVVSLAYHDLLLESICEAAKQADIRDGVLMTGIGSLTRGHIHWVTTNEVPPENRFLKLPGPLEIVNFGGIIADYEPHVHINLMDANCKFYGGHLEPDSEVLTLSEISILRLPDLKMTRHVADWTYKMRLLDSE